jgi:ribosomal protein S18 acetylase RimI-like enzyme
LVAEGVVRRLNAVIFAAMANLELLRFELASERDAASIAALSREAIEMGLQPAWVPARVLRRVRDAESTVLVARTELGSMAGFAIMRFGEDAAHLDLLAVTAHWRRRGLGRRRARLSLRSKCGPTTQVVARSIAAGATTSCQN